MADQQTVRAYIKGIDQSPRKVSLVASLVRGRSTADASVILANTPKRAALAVKKAIASAEASAVNNYNLDKKTLKISSLSVTAGSRMKRYRPASRGRALPFQKRSSHILVEIVGQEKPKKPAATAKTKASAEKENK